MGLLSNVNIVLQIDGSDKREAAALRLSLAEKFTLGKYKDELAKVIGTPVMGDCIHFTTGGRWSAHNLLHYLIGFTGPVNVWMSTYTISEDAVRLLSIMLDAGSILELHALIDKRFDGRNPRAMQFAKQRFNSLKLRDCHAKVTVLFNNEWAISMVGSANYSNNPRIERGTIFCSREVADFDKNWIEKEILNEKPFGV